MGFKTEIRVRYADTDRMGVVYHSNYFIWMEVGRTELFREMGLTYKDIESKGVLLPVIEAFCEYKKPALYDDELVIETFINNYSAARVTIHYDIFRKEDHVLLARGRTVHGIVGKEGKPLSIKKIPWLKEKIDEIIKNYGSIS